jgi:hypothetical protein
VQKPAYVNILFTLQAYFIVRKAVSVFFPGSFSIQFHASLSTCRRPAMAGGFVFKKAREEYFSLLHFVAFPP